MGARSEGEIDTSYVAIFVHVYRCTDAKWWNFWYRHVYTDFSALSLQVPYRTFLVTEIDGPRADSKVYTAHPAFQE